MVKGGKVSSKRRVKPRIRSNYKGSNDSDEDYVVSDEEKLVSEDLEEDYCSSVDGNASEESFGNYVEEEEEEEVRWARKNSRSRAKKGGDRFIEEGEEEEYEEEIEKVRKNGRSRAKKGIDNFVVDEEEDDELEEEEDEDEEEIKKVRKKGRSRAKKGKDRFIMDEEEDELEELEDEEEDEEEMKKVRKKGRSRAKKGKDRFIVDEWDDELEELEEEEEEKKDEEAMKELRKVARSKSQNGFSSRQKHGVKPSQKRRRTKDEEMADQDYEEEEEEDDDEEFTPDEDDYSELEEESRVRKKTNLKVGKRRLKKKGPIRRKSKKPLRKKQKKNRKLRRKVRSDDDDGDFMDSDFKENKEKKKPKKRRRFEAPSDSDFVSSGSSDRDYTISEEEREQVREAMQLCGSVEPNLKSSLPCDKIQQDDIVKPPRKPPGRKGKDKIEQVTVKVVKQVCGICLSEEDKRRVRGTLDCCTHYFCFSCIMEWGKVESRCPLCKQRFKTISKPTRAGTDLKEVSITVPERDQVYQPTEEELRSYLDPYENVICTECHEGGDDGLMLLCDVCDSPAHTYCVGLGQEVPEGNWYCDGCRPVALGSSSSQVQGWPTEQRTTNNILHNRHSPTVSFGEGLEIDLNALSSPRSYIAQGFGNSSSPYFHVGGFQAASPGSGAGAPTLSGRRIMHRHIQQLISANRMSFLASRNERNSSANLSSDTLNAQTAQGREIIGQHARTGGMGRSFHTFFEERLQENGSLQVQDNDISPSTSNHQRRQVVQDATATSAGRLSNGTLWPGLAENTVSGHVQTHHSSRPNIGFDGDVSPNAVMGSSDFHRAKEQLQSLVIRHLKDLSRERDIGQNTTTFQEIARSAMQTILAACEMEHITGVAVPVPPPSPCPHIELAAGKTSLMRGCCSSCFAQFVEDVVKKVMEHKLSPWLTLGL